MQSGCAAPALCRTSRPPWSHAAPAIACARPLAAAPAQARAAAVQMRTLDRAQQRSNYGQAGQHWHVRAQRGRRARARPHPPHRFGRAHARRRGLGGSLPCREARGAAQASACWLSRSAARRACPTGAARCGAWPRRLTTRRTPASTCCSSLTRAAAGTRVRRAPPAPRLARLAARQPRAWPMHAHRPASAPASNRTCPDVRTPHASGAP